MTILVENQKYLKHNLYCKYLIQHTNWEYIDTKLNCRKLLTNIFEFDVQMSTNKCTAANLMIKFQSYLLMCLSIVKKYKQTHFRYKVNER